MVQLAVSNELHREITIHSPIKEITSDASYGLIIDETIVKEMTEGDSDPQFVIVEVETGKSKNNIHYDKEFMQSVARQVVEKQPVGYLGHKHMQGLDKEDLLPDPQTVWLAADVRDNKLILKGYLLPGSKIRGWIKHKAVNSVSWSGDGTLVPAPSGGYRIKDFELESIDWSRKNKEGVRNRVLATVTEMEGGRKVTAEEVASLQLAELRQHNPGLVAAIEESAKAEERQKAVKEMETEKTKIEDKHAEDVKELPEVKELSKLRAFLKLDENASVWDAVSALYEKAEELAKGNIDAWFKDKLKELVPNEKARGLVQRLVPITEMEGKTFIYDAEDHKKSLEQQAKELVETDEDIQTVIKEMGSSRGGLNLAHQEKKGAGGEEKVNSSNLEEVEATL